MILRSGLRAQGSGVQGIRLKAWAWVQNHVAWLATPSVARFGQVPGLAEGSSLRVPGFGFPSRQTHKTGLEPVMYNRSREGHPYHNGFLRPSVRV